MASVYRVRRSLLAAPSGRFGSWRFSWAIGEKKTSRGADRPSYFCPRMPSIVVASSFRKASRLPGPRRASLRPKKARTTPALTLASHSSGVPKFSSRGRMVSSSPAKPRLRNTSSRPGWAAWIRVSSQPACCIRSASVLPMTAMLSPFWSTSRGSAAPAGGTAAAASAAATSQAPQRRAIRGRGRRFPVVCAIPDRLIGCSRHMTASQTPECRRDPESALARRKS